MKNTNFQIGEQIWVYLADADIWGSGEVVGFTPKRIKINVTCRMTEYVGNFKPESVAKKDAFEGSAL